MTSRNGLVGYKVVAKIHLLYIFICFVISLLHIVPGVLDSSFSDFLNVSLKYPTYWFLGIVAYIGYRIDDLRFGVSALFFMGAYFLLNHPGVSGLAFADTLIFPSFVFIVLFTSILLMLTVQGSLRIEVGNLTKLLVSLWPVVAFVTVANLKPSLVLAAISYEVKVGGGYFPISLSLFLLIPFAMWRLRLMSNKRTGFLHYSLIIAVSPLALSFDSLTSGSPSNMWFFSGISLVLLHACLSTFWQWMYIDELTEIPNRRALEEKLQSLKGDFIICMIDVDHFKKFNDNYGHDEGDNVLRLVARNLYEVSGRRGYRYGGEEFCVVFENGDVEEAYMVVDHIREKIENKKFFLRQSLRLNKEGEKVTAKPSSSEIDLDRPVKITISAGLSLGSQKYSYIDDVFKEADETLYKAKESGRNTVLVSGYCVENIKSYNKTLMPEEQPSAIAVKIS